MKERIMGVALSGKFKSFYAGKKVPAADEEKKTPALPQQKEPSFKPESKETKLIVVGNSRFITENFPAEFDGNRIFFQNVIDWVTVGDALIGIRSRESTDRPLMVISEQAKAAIRFINILGVSILAGLFGLGRFYLRRRRKKNGIQRDLNAEGYYENDIFCERTESAMSFKKTIHTCSSAVLSTPGVLSHREPEKRC